MRTEQEVREMMDALEQQFESADYWAETAHQYLEWVVEDRDKEMFPLK